MSFKRLGLGNIELIDSAERLSLLVSATTDVRVDDTSQQLTPDLLESGNFWVSRGAGCHFEVEVLFKSEPLDQSSRLKILQSVGSRIRDAKLWSLLCLSTTLDIPAEDLKPQAQLFVTINQSPTLPPPPADSKLCPLQFHDGGLTPPPSVVSAKLEKVQMQLNFIPVEDNNNTQPMVKRNKTKHGRTESPEIMLLDPGLGTTCGTHLDDLEVVVSSLQGLSHSMLKCFGTETGSHVSNPQVEGKHGRVSSEHIIATFESWLTSNIDKETASEADKLELMKQAGLQRGQISRALKYHHKNIISRQLVHEDDMLFASAPPQHSTVSDDQETLLFNNELEINAMSALGDEEMLLVTDLEESLGRGLTNGAPDDDDDMLFSQPSSTTLLTPSPIRTSSTITSVESIRSLENPLKRATPNGTDIPDQAGTLSIVFTSRLVDVALRTLVGGQIHCQQSMPKGVILRKPLPKSSLSAVAPVIFSPGFHDSMVKNSRFLPVISRSISTSILRNAQSPILKEKLAKLVELTPPTASLHDYLTSANTRDERLASTLQSRIWAMMQKTLFDPAAVRHLWRTHLKEHKESGDEEFTDLLWQGRDTGDRETEGDSAGNEFEDLFDDDDDDDDYIEYLEGPAMEQLEIERETEEMLLGGVTSEEVDEDEILLVGRTDDSLL